MYLDIEGNIMDGTFIRRVNRFIAEVSIDNTTQIAHVPNTGRMKELLDKGVKVILRKVDLILVL